MHFIVVADIKMLNGVMIVTSVMFRLCFLLESRLCNVLMETRQPETVG